MDKHISDIYTQLDGVLYSDDLKPKYNRVWL